MPESRPSVDEYGRGYRDGLAAAERQIAALEESRDRLGRELATAHAGVGMERARGDKALARVAELEADLALRKIGADEVDRDQVRLLKERDTLAAALAARDAVMAEVRKRCENSAVSMHFSGGPKYVSLKTLREIIDRALSAQPTERSPMDCRCEGCNCELYEDNYRRAEDAELCTECYAELLAAQPVETGEQLDRTLTLPNGVEVRAGGVLVCEDAILRVTAVGEMDWLAVGIDADGKTVIGELKESGATCVDWRPWSAVYPDRPAPGGEE